MDADEFNLSNTLNDSLDSSLESLLSIICDSAFTELAESSIFGEIPFFRLIISTFKIGKNVRDIHYLKKIARFILEVENGLDSKKLEKYKKTLEENSDKISKEIEYIILIIDRYVEDLKATYLAKLYIAFLNRHINWDLFCSYSIVLDRLMIGDIKFLQNGLYFMIGGNSEHFDSVARLESCGLIYRETPKMYLNDSMEVVENPLSSDKYRKSIYGSKFLFCLFGPRG